MWQRGTAHEAAGGGGVSEDKGMRWDGTVAVVTGASRGIGREVVRMASARGAGVGLVARTRPDLEAVLEEIGGRGAVATADMGNREEAEAAIAQLADQLGPVDIL